MPTPPGPITIPPTTLAPAQVTEQLRARVSSTGSWSPNVTGPFRAVALEDDAASYAFMATDSQVHVYALQERGVPAPTGIALDVPDGRVYEKMTVDEGLLAVRTDSPQGNATHLFDVSDVARPRLLGTYRGWGQLLDVEGGRVYLLGQYNTATRGAPVLVLPVETYPQVSYRLEPFGMLSAFKAVGNMAYVASFNERERVARFTVFDLSDPGAPIELGHAEASGSAIEVSGGYAYLMTEGLGVQIVDVSDTAHPSKVGELRGDPREMGSSGGIRQPVRMRVAGGLLYSLAWGGDWGVARWRLLVIDVSDPARPVEVGRAEGSGAAQTLWLQGEQGVVVDSYGVSVIDLSDPAQPNEMEQAPAQAAPSAVFLWEEHAYLFLRSGLFDLDLSQPGAPRLAGFHYFGPVDPVRDMGGGTYIAGVYGWNTSYRVEVSGLEEPKLTRLEGTRVDLPYATVGPYRYLPGCSGFRVQDPAQSIASLRNVREIYLASTENCVGMWDVTVVGNLLYVVGNGRLYLFDASDPASPRALAEQGLHGDTQVASADQARILVEGDRAYILHGGLWVLDLSDPLSPAEVAYYATDALELDVDGDRIALAGPDGAFELLKLDLGR